MLDLLNKVERTMARIDRMVGPDTLPELTPVVENVGKIWKPQEKQQQLLELCGLDEAVFGGPVKPAVTELIGYGGAAFGGKTEGLVAIGMTACKMIPGVQVGYFRRTFSELEGADGPIIRSQDLYTQLGARYIDGKHYWKDWGNGARMFFCHCQHEKDVFRYQSQAFDILLIDEATHFSWFIIDYLVTRNRVSKNSQIPHPFTVMCTNPGNIGHLWYLQLFDVMEEKGPNGHPKLCRSQNDVEERTLFLAARLEDNQLGLAKDPEYEARLMRRDPVLAKALRYGDWTVFAGQALGMFSKARHVVEPFPIPANWQRWRMVDWGFDAPFCCLWIAKNPDNGRMYVYREAYRPGLLDQQQARLIRDSSLDTEIFTWNFGDPSMWTRRTTGVEKPTSTYDVYLANGIYLTKADNDQLTKLRKVRSVLGDHWDGEPILKIFSTCQNLIRTLPALMTDPNNPEYLLDGQEEHAFDALAYGLTKWTPPETPDERQRKIQQQHMNNNPWTQGMRQRQRR